MKRLVLVLLISLPLYAAGFGDWYDHGPNIQIQFNFGDWFTCPTTAPCTQTQAVPVVLKSTPVHVEVFVDGTKTWIYPDRIVNGRLNQQCWTLTIARDDITKSIRPMMTVDRKYPNGVDSETVLGFAGTSEPIGMSAATTCISATPTPLAAVTMSQRDLEYPPFVCDEGCQLLVEIAERQMARPATMSVLESSALIGGWPVQKVANVNSGDYPKNYAVRPWCDRNERNEPRTPADRRACYAKNPDTVLSAWVGPSDVERRVIALLGASGTIMQGWGVKQLETSDGWIAIPVDMREGATAGRQLIELWIADAQYGLCTSAACGAKLLHPTVDVTAIPFAPAAGAETVTTTVRRREVRQ